jgi:hypothetical protein
MIHRLFALTIFTALFSLPVAAEDRHAGYYYPMPKSQEEYVARSRTLPDSDKDRRIGFIVGFTGELAKDPAPQRFAIFAKGAQAEKLIIVALDDNAFATLFRARAMLAMLTTRVRASPLFAEFGVQTLFTFYDLAKLLGFTQITVSDGRNWSHRVDIK